MSASHHPLAKNLRTQLENTVKSARNVAEIAAHAALTNLGVGHREPYSHLTDEQKVLRRRLRAHGRQLGDVKYEDESQETRHLVWEVAYEHWHRMLFAHFLAENHLLMWEAGAPVTLVECDELVQDPGTSFGAKSGWELAGMLAARMLPQIFKPQSPALAVIFAPEHQRELEKLLSNLSGEVFQASDSLGWVYQFWQAKRKDEVNASEVKIGSDELPAVTQLFTEPYMVDFILHNTLGAWWNTRHPDKSSPVELTYFRTLEDGTPAAGRFEGWEDSLANFKFLDPCCGSGHFLVGAFMMLVPMRMAAEGLSAADAVTSVLESNLHGLEIDPRCVEVAAFALALAAWRYPDSGGYRQLPALNIACAGLPITATESEWLALAGEQNNLQVALSELYRQFRDASVLGSMIDFEKGINGSSLFDTSWREIQPLLEIALAKETDDQSIEYGVVAKGVSHAADLLSRKYHLLATNPPYLVRGKQSERLRDYLASYYPAGDADIATVFLKRFDGFLVRGGVHASVTPLNWYYLKS